MEYIKEIINFAATSDVNGILILMIIFQGYIIYKQGKLTIDMYNLKDSKIEKLIGVNIQQNKVIGDFTTRINDIFNLLMNERFNNKK